MDLLGLVFQYLAEHSYEARLRDGNLLRDATDFRYFLRELAEAAQVAECRSSTEVANSAGHLDRTCRRCGHVHQGAPECEQEIGAGRICRCALWPALRNLELPA